MTTLDASGTTSLRRALLGVAIVTLSLSALMGVLALVSGGTFGETEGRILMTTLVVGCASICLLCYLATAGTPFVAVGAVGGVVLVLPVLTALRLIWADWGTFPDEGWWKALGVGVVLALTLAQASLLLALTGARPGLRALLGATLALALALAGLLVAMILGEVDIDGVWRTLGVIAILDVLGTLVTIILARFGGRQPTPPTPATPARLRVPAELESRLAARAEADGRDADELLTEALERYLRAG